MTRKARGEHGGDPATRHGTERLRRISLARCWISAVAFTVVSCGEAVQVSARDGRRFALLFQSVVLPCQYSSVSTQTPVVQWWYKSYCRDRSRDSFRFPDSLAFHGSELGPNPHLDCGDTSRTVRIVASGQGSSITLSEHYRGRDIAIINKADLRIGELQWGDSGVYFCKVVISDDLEGQNEAYVELLVLGQTSLADDLLPGFNVEIVPEWVFVSAVVMGSALVILLVGVCWCQCCPHSCCCYVRCCCCPETCCCPRHLYEAGKGLKTAVPAPVPIFPPYYIPGMPTMVPITPPSLIDPHLSTSPSLENNGSAVRSGFHLQSASDQSSLKVLQFVEEQLAQFNPSQTLSSRDSCGMSELSSLHDAETDFRHTYRQVQKKALAAIPDLDPAELRTADLSPVHEGRCTQEQDNPRWNSRSEHLQRKAFLERGRTGSLDELEEFAMTYMQRGRHGDDYRGKERERERERELERERERERERELERDRYPFYCSNRDSPKASPARRPPSPPPMPGKRWDSRDNDRDPSGTGSRRGYDNVLLNDLLERKAKAKAGSSKAGRTEEDSDTPSRTPSSSRKPSGSPRPRTDEDNEALPPYTETELERSRGAESGKQAFGCMRSSHGSTGSGSEEHNRPRKVSTLLSRDSLIV
ncbi:immunoglobulin-like domain-containing receptor 2 isoform X2 [Pseudorasbora parva]|uniref:immunoglobulin-like domain-containing receptor 2 isoform X2 n=1 Tax=Pseudorasbora parva TaxID=51549 RepID=UPI00351F4DE7